VRFVVSYFGLSAVEIADRFVHRRPIDVLTASAHEQQTYAIQRRFDQWLAEGKPETR
jgi:hypothetical protein